MLRPTGNCILEHAGYPLPAPPVTLFPHSPSLFSLPLFLLPPTQSRVTSVRAHARALIVRVRGFQSVATTESRERLLPLRPATWRPERMTDVLFGALAEHSEKLVDLHCFKRKEKSSHGKLRRVSVAGAR